MVYSDFMVKPPLSRKRQRTRAALVESALAIIAERGIAAVTLDEIAARAGVTKGAIYSNYRSKGELLWEAVDRRRPHLAPEATPGDPAAQARAVARAIMASLPEAEREAAFHSELQIYIRTDPELRAQQAEQQKAQLNDISRQLATDFGDQLTMPPRTVALAIQALILGFTAQWERTPDEVTEEVVTAALEALAIGATAPR